MRMRFLLILGAALLPGYRVAAQSAGSRAPQTEQKVPGLDLNTNRINVLHSLYPALDGAGLTVSIKENRYDTTDIDLWGRHRPSALESAFTATHAGLMATLVAGAGNSYHTGRGVARGAQVASADFLNLWPDGKDYYESLGISVQNHSYGVGIENFYGADAAAYDASVRELPYLLHVFSAGNRGDQSSESGSYAGLNGYANLTGSFKMAKNVLTVAAVEQNLSINARVSKGPAYDGRLKPDLAAAGQDGSSGAAALVSGAALLLQQRYREQQGDLPPAALVRALLLNSAEDIGPPGIDYESGYGNLNAWRAVQTLERQTFLLGALNQNGQDSLAIVLPPNVHELKLTLAWTDPPADSLAAKALINDLDVELFHPATGRTWRPWVLSAYPHPDSLARPARRDRDTLNNAEQISLVRPLAGEYHIRIRGAGVRQGPQSYALVYDWDAGGLFQWTHPAPGNHLEAGERANLRWMTNLEDAPAILEYTLDEGRSWRLLSDTAGLHDEYWLWEVPDAFAPAQLRLRTQTDTFPSPAFYIYRGQRLQVGFDCEESILLYWNPVEAADRYVVYTLEEQYLQPMAILQDTFLEIDKATAPSIYYAVGPLLSDTPENLRGPTINYTFQGVGCYFKSFFAEVHNGSQGRLRLELGAVFGIRSIVFEKRIGDQFQPIGAITPDGRLTYEFFDPDLQTGRNIYRVRLDLQAGEPQFSNEDLLYYVPAEQYLVYPNPVRSGEALNVVSGTIDSSERIFYLFDGLGRQVGVLPLGIPFEYLEPDYLPEGVYFYEIRKDGRRQQAGKVVVVRE